MNVQMALMKLGAGVEDVQESLVLTVDVREKMLRALRQAHNGLQVDDLRAGGLWVRFGDAVCYIFIGKFTI